MLDLFLFIALSFVMVVVIVVMYFAIHTVNTHLNNNVEVFNNAMPDGNGQELLDNTMGQVAQSYNVLPWIVVFFVFGYALALLIGSFLVKTHPVFFIGYFFLIVIGVVISVYISNTYETLMLNENLASTFLQFPGANIIFLHFPIWVAVIGIIASILTYINIDWGGIYS